MININFEGVGRVEVRLPGNRRWYLCFDGAAVYVRELGDDIYFQAWPHPSSSFVGPMSFFRY